MADQEQQNAAQEVIYISDKPFLMVDVTNEWTARFENGTLKLTDPKQIEAMKEYRRTAPNSSTSLFKELNMDNARRVALEHQKNFAQQPSSIQGAHTSQSHEAAKQNILSLQNADALARSSSPVPVGTYDPGKDADPNLVHAEEVTEPQKLVLNLGGQQAVNTTPANNQAGAPVKNINSPLKPFDFKKV